MTLSMRSAIVRNIPLTSFNFEDDLESGYQNSISCIGNGRKYKVNSVEKFISKT